LGNAWGARKISAASANNNVANAEAM